MFGYDPSATWKLEPAIRKHGRLAVTQAWRTHESRNAKRVA